MAFPDDLLDQAFFLVNKEPKNAKQASLRRAVSTAYYALFHLLIAETIANWSRVSSRAKLVRAFDHRPMKSACARISDSRAFPFAGEDPAVVTQLKMVANTFIQLQEKRHIADYDNATSWVRTDALAEVEATGLAFSAWKSIRSENIAQDFLVSLLVKHRD